MYADDTAVIATSMQENQATSYTQRHLNLLLQYFNKWKLKINEEKTRTIIFTKRTRRRQARVNIGNTAIEEEQHLKYLGVTLDKRLNFNKHIRNTKRKANAAKSLIAPYIHYTTPLNKNLKLRICKAYITSILTYAAPVWCSTSKSNINTLQAIENRALRIIIGKYAGKSAINNYITTQK